MDSLFQMKEMKRHIIENLEREKNTIKIELLKESLEEIQELIDDNL